MRNVNYFFYVFFGIGNEKKCMQLKSDEKAEATTKEKKC